jgi:hypothetical protein
VNFDPRAAEQYPGFQGPDARRGLGCGPANRRGDGYEELFDFNRRFLGGQEVLGDAPEAGHRLEGAACRPQDSGAAPPAGGFWSSPMILTSSDLDSRRLAWLKLSEPDFRGDPPGPVTGTDRSTQPLRLLETLSLAAGFGLLAGIGEALVPRFPQVRPESLGSSAIWTCSGPVRSHPSSWSCLWEFCSSFCPGSCRR